MRLSANAAVASFCIIYMLCVLRSVPSFESVLGDEGPRQGKKDMGRPFGNLLRASETRHVLCPRTISTYGRMARWEQALHLMTEIGPGDTCELEGWSTDILSLLLEPLAERRLI